MFALTVSQFKEELFNFAQESLNGIPRFDILLLDRSTEKSHSFSNKVKSICYIFQILLL